jgi:hypothetical protein
MQVLDFPTLANVRYFARGADAVTHYRVTAAGVVCFRMEACDRCGAPCVGANPITFTHHTARRSAHLFNAARLIASDVVDELGANDDGDAVCPACYDAPAAPAPAPAPAPAAGVAGLVDLVALAARISG